MIKTTVWDSFWIGFFSGWASLWLLTAMKILR